MDDLCAVIKAFAVALLPLLLCGGGSADGGSREDRGDRGDDGAAVCSGVYRSCCVETTDGVRCDTVFLDTEASQGFDDDDNDDDGGSRAKVAVAGTAEAAGETRGEEKAAVKAEAPQTPLSLLSSSSSLRPSVN